MRVGDENFWLLMAFLLFMFAMAYGLHVEGWWRLDGVALIQP